MDKRKMIHEILDLILDINGMEERKRSSTGDKPTAFFSYSGHINGLSVQVYGKGWTANGDPDIMPYAYVGWKDDRLIKMLDDLKRFKEEMANAL